MNALKTVNQYALIDYGVEYPEHLPNWSLAHTPFQYKEIGAGTDRAEALNHLLAAVAGQNFDAGALLRRIKTDEGWQDGIPDITQAQRQSLYDGVSQYFVCLLWN